MSDVVLVPPAIVCGHGEFSRGLVSAVDQITGRGDMFVPLSNMGLSGSDLESRLRELILTHGSRWIFTDLPAGSATIAARRLLQSSPRLILVTGVNLAALLDFVFSGALSPAAAASQAIERGRAAMTTTGT